VRLVFKASTILGIAPAFARQKALLRISSTLALLLLYVSNDTHVWHGRFHTWQEDTCQRRDLCAGICPAVLFFVSVDASYLSGFLTPFLL
jgi:hypothetical protein